jgi:ribosomal protein S18 acetylase RimI-like enzyme
MNTVTIAPYADPAHRAQVVALWESAFKYDAAHNKPTVSIDKKLEANDGLFLVALNGSSVVGTVMAGYDGHRGWIYSVAVDAAYRRKGIGSKLVAAAERALIERGCVKINLQIMEGNEDVVGFYTSLGFAVEKRISMGKRILRN